MGTTSEKLTYLNNTKQLLKDKINNLGGDITDQTTFRQYANQLQNVYDNLPKTEYQEGTEVTLSNTLKGKLDYENGVVGIGQVSQDSTQGYQLWSLKDGTYSHNGAVAKVENGEITINGTTTAIAFVSIPLNNVANWQTGQTYMISANNASAGQVRLRINDTGSADLFLDSANATKSVTYNEKSVPSVRTDIITLRIQDGITLTNFKLKPMLETGSTAHDWEQYTGGQASPNPSYPQTINSVTGNQDVVVSGKNRLEAKLNTVTNNGITVTNNNDGTFTINGTNTSTSVVTFRLDEPNFHTYEDGTYTLDKGTTNTDIFIRLMQNETWAQIITVSYDERLKSQAISNATNTFIYIGIKGSATINNVTIKPMFVKGSYTVETIGNFEPYITPKSYQLSLGDIELNAIGNYKDYIWTDRSTKKWYKHKVIEKVVLTGASAESWNLNGNEALFVHTGINLGVMLPYDDVPLILSNYYSAKPFGEIYGKDHDYGISFGASQADRLCIRNSELEGNVANFKTWLTTHNTSAYYPLATETDEEITGTLAEQLEAWYNAHSNNGTTIITSNGNLPMIIKVRGLKGE